MKSNKEKGDLFEKKVESIYQNLGYQTKRNILINGKQVDIVASRLIAGLGNFVLLIECKFLTEGSVSNQVIYNFDSFLKASKDSYPFDKGIIVSNLSFSKESKLHVSNLIELKTSDGLEKEIFNLREAYLQIINEYVNTPVFNEYIPLRANFKNTQIENLEEYIIKDITIFRQESSGNFFSILGDYGSGKTTVMKRIFHVLSKKYIENELSRKPFYIELKLYNKHQDIELFFINSYFNQFKRQISFESLFKEIRNGGFILLLDGFDEMSPQVNRKRRFENFRLLTPFILSNSYTLLTCRPSYFVTYSEYKGFLENINRLDDKVGHTFIGTTIYESRKLQMGIEGTYRKLYEKYIINQDLAYKFSIKNIKTITLNDFSDSQIDSYLEQFNSEFIDNCDTSSKEIKKFLLEIYDLEELMTKPLLLSMIKDTILSMGQHFIKAIHNFTPSGLYELYTNINLDVEWNKGASRHFLTKPQRRSFAEVIAFLMFENTISEVNYSQIVEMITSKEHIYLTESLDIIATSKIEDIASDIQICTFLTRTEDNKFKFIHKSFMEFFVARHLKNLIMENEADEILSSKNFPYEVLFFLGCFGFIEQRFATRLRSNLRKLKVSNIYKRNVSAAYIYTSIEHENFKLSKTSLMELQLKKSVFTSCKWTHLELFKIKFHNLRFVKSNLSESVIKECDFKEVVFENSTFSNTVENSKFHKVEFISPFIKTPFKIMSEGSFFEKSKFEYIDLTISGNCKFSDTTFLNCKIIFTNSKGLISFEACNFMQCEFFDETDGYTIQLNKCIVKNSTFNPTKVVSHYIMFLSNKFLETIGDFHINISFATINYKNYGFDKKTGKKLMDKNLCLINDYSVSK